MLVVTSVMDVHEKQSFAPAGRWRGFQFSTLVVCVFGILGNVSALAVLCRHLKEIAGSRLLLALAVADLGVVVSVAFRILAYVTYNNNWMTQVLDWWFLYCYYCSIYLTVLLSMDRYLHTAKAMLLLRINYQRILKRAILGVFASMLLFTFPNFLAIFVYYHHGAHLGTITVSGCLSEEFCKSSPIRVEASICQPVVAEGISLANLSEAEMEAYNALKSVLCSMSKKYNYTGYACRGQRIQVPAPKFQPNINIIFSVDKTLDDIKLCRVGKMPMRYDSDFVKTVYLGIDLPFRYVIPCCVLVFLNISLVVSVVKAQRSHSDISGTPNKSLLELPVLRSAVGIVFVFLLCHTGGAGIFVLDVFRVFAEHTDGLLGTTVTLFIDEHLATTGLEMKYSGILLAALNSSVNIVLYCLFLPSFRQHWASLFSMFKCHRMRERNGRGRDPIQHMDGIALPTLIAVSQSRGGGGVSFLL